MLILIYKLCNERYSGPLTDLGITEGDITDAVIYPEDREPLFRTCSTQKKNLITEIISAAIERARDSDPFFSRKDALQILVDYNKQTRTDANKKELLQDEIVANISAFIFVAFDTTSTLLLLTSHFLMYHPEVQERARNEAVQVLKDKPEPDYEDLAKLEYIDQVLSEVLRLYPASLIISSCRLYLHRFVASGISRRSEQDYHLPGHLTIPRGLPVIMALPAMHYSPKIWSEPHKFDPDRFAPEARSSIPPLAYQPFGAGPRTCLGMKLALLASRLVVARLLLRYRLRPGPGTDQEFPEIRDTMLILHPKNDVVGILEPLESSLQ
ncbi:TBXAS1 [Cordylochernes scorpioides]|uniref:TBXAS1 n=1 Tax=Cordylochernes scorpioides TaxID=51811 RepID=A0ABY6KQN5_9ARAC|nr:TBXAS1 [Cordylochernes scorpioides]